MKKVALLVPMSAALLAIPSAAAAASLSASLNVNVACFGECGAFTADNTSKFDAGSGGVAAVTYDGVHATARSKTDEPAGILAVEQSGSLSVPTGASGNVYVNTDTKISDTITLSAPAVLTLHGAATADVDGGSRAYVIAEIDVGNDSPVYEEYVAKASGTRSFSVPLSLPAGTSTFFATLRARIEGLPSGGETYSGVVRPSTLTFAIDVPGGVTATSGSGLLPLKSAAPPPPPPPPSGPCILVEPAGDVDFGTARLSGAGNAVTVGGSPDVTVKSCSDAAEDVSVRGTSATGSGASWSLVDSSANPCSLGTNIFELALGAFPVAPNAKQWASLAAGAVKTATPKLTMPCTGSDGVGQTLRTQLVFTASS